MSRATELADWLNQCIAASDDPEKVLACSAELRRLDRVNAELRDLLEGVLKIGRGTSGRIILEGWHEEALRAALTSSGDHL